MLQFLARDADWQQANIGCCADCNLGPYHLEYLHACVNGVPPHLLPRAHEHLQALMAACEALIHEAYVNLEGNHFEHPQWAPLRTATQEALALLDWHEFEAHAGAGGGLPRGHGEVAALVPLKPPRSAHGKPSRA
ncbi:hypothetical protein [Metapseudomonas otitidis]|uniref:hypothetical protein n=1 Tax=Metapseudomonas otitidis TaxID=319939 RepID=UPI001F0E2E8E|nr:hypothetical protein [Pseudomonas otitidis]